MLEELCKQDKRWRQVALNICGCESLADDMVQDMYLRVAHKNEFNSTFIYRVLLNIFIDYGRIKKEFTVDELLNLRSIDLDFEPNDFEQEILDRIEELNYHQKEFIMESYDRSYREIESIYNINYHFIYRESKKAVIQVLQDDIGMYNNSSLKHKKAIGKHKKK